MNNTQKKQVGERIKKIRTSLGLTMSEFGKKFDPPASDSIVSRWESGKSLPNNERLKQITEFSKVSMAFLLEGKYLLGDIHVLPEEEQAKIQMDTYNQTLKLKESLSKSIEKTFDSLNEQDLPLVDLLILNNTLIYINNLQTINNSEYLTQLNGIITGLNKAYYYHQSGEYTSDEKKELLDSSKQDIMKLFSNFVDNFYKYLQND